MEYLPGSPYPLGATWDGEGVNFAIYSEHAHTVDLCLFDAAPAEVPPATAVILAVARHDRET